MKYDAYPPYLFATSTPWMEKFKQAQRIWELTDVYLEWPISTFSESNQETQTVQVRKEDILREELPSVFGQLPSSKQALLVLSIQ